MKRRYVDGSPVAVTYTAIASYTTTVYARYATGYTVTVDYIGDITKTSVDTIIYTAVFSAENTSHGETHLEQEPEAAANPDVEAQRDLPEAAEATEQSANARKIVLLILAAVIALALFGYGGWRGYQYIRDKKRGYR